MSGRNKNLSLKDILDYLEELDSEEQSELDQQVVSVYIEPPEEGMTSGEDDANDDDGGTPDNLCGGQLRAGCEIEFANGDRMNSFERAIETLAVDVIDENQLNTVDNFREIAIGPSKSEATQSRASRVDTTSPHVAEGEKNDAFCRLPIFDLNQDYEWEADSSIAMFPIFPDANYEDCRNVKPHEQFEKFFDLEVLQHIVDCTNLYINYKNKKMDPVTVNELRVVIGILLVGGYVGQRSFRNMWSTETDLRNEMVFNSMRRNRFENIIWSLHFEKNLCVPDVLTDRMWKLRPLTDLIKANMLKHFHHEQHLSYDESMIAYFGKHGCKQFIRGKPLRFGYKVWSLCTPSGYLINFEIYQGKNPRGNNLYEARLGKCAAPLINMIDDFNDDQQRLPFAFYFDNLFTGFPLLQYLKERSFHATGTIRENRIPKKCPMPSKEKLKKMPRGHIESLKMVTNGIRLTKWVDNSVVCIASTDFGDQPISMVSRFSKALHKKISVNRPCVVSEYNKYMCGVDRFDENVSLYRIAYRGKKWWFSIFTWLVDASVQNAWQIHRKVHPMTTQFQFKREIAVYYCKHYGEGPKSTSASRSAKRKCSAGLETTLRYDRTDHFVVPIDKKRRCAGDECSSIVRTQCNKCNVGLCLKCFKPYHTLD